MQADYNFKYLEADATISPFVEDALGGTDVMAHEGVVGLKAFPQTTLMGTVQMRNSIATPADPVYTLRMIVMQSF